MPFFSWELTTNKADNSTIIYPKDKYYLSSPVILDGGTPALLKFKFASLDAQTIELNESHTYYADKDKEIKQLIRTIKLKVT